MNHSKNHSQENKPNVRTVAGYAPSARSNHRKANARTLLPALALALTRAQNQIREREEKRSMENFDKPSGIRM
ncbi:hypothetical protein HETIRDRAFT_411164 [Heterobasidion irregulare TC 32-1]|uniref:Uncharacterized protein n=1 Tax=Heterobasidion irregulare (strain TC 32-1) TaxID=747525 RepID=W4JWR3_HETIT|nr:uncharacterized protein HETIRDRAFT_411164 [Heterobasidion irregulare TC 32-1]ETW77894.1 hypothetical protein HETIRDRAFT_411164 [Heterobasidion irregulare TC 32-1]